VALNFPNPSRMYDAAHSAIRFWGYDGAMESVFFVTEGALVQVQPQVELDEAGFLRAFDLNRTLIYAAAAKVYARGRKAYYELGTADF
jgi:Protein of unknown function (DUF1488)